MKRLDERNERVLTDYLNGKTIPEIEKEYGMHNSSVYALIKAELRRRSPKLYSRFILTKEYERLKKKLEDTLAKDPSIEMGAIYSDILSLMRDAISANEKRYKDEVNLCLKK